MVNDTKYGCSGYVDGRACSNGVLVRRDDLETKLISPIHDYLLSPERIAIMASEIEALLAEEAKTGGAPEQSEQLVQLNTRIDRLRERQRQGDPDLTPDELQSAIDPALQKRRELEAVQPQGKHHSAILSGITQSGSPVSPTESDVAGGDAEGTAAAREVLRQLFAGPVVLEPREDRSRWAVFELEPAVLVSAGLDSVGSRYGPCRSRTYDQEIKSLLLYQLS